jgi:hypothetical protein
MNGDSIVSILISTLHFYASLIIGGIVFHQYIYPYWYVAPGNAHAVLETVPVYGLNVLAFTALVFVLSRSLFLLFDHILSTLLQALDKSRK